MNSQIRRLPKNTIELTLTITPDQAQKTYDRLVDEMVKTAEIQGFRKGKAPRAMVEERIDRVKFNEEILRQLLPEVYTNAVREHNITPIVNPKIDIISMVQGKDWQFKAVTCEQPEVVLKDFKDKVKNITAKSKIVVPGKEPQQPKAEEIFNAILEGASVELADFVIDAEVDRLLSHLLQEIKSLGLSLEQYLQTIGKNPQTLRDEYRKQAERDLQLEFILEKIADEEKITVAKEEIDSAIAAIKNEDEKQAVAQNPYMLASVLRRQKTLDFIRRL